MTAMRFEQFDDRYMLRLETGEALIETLTSFAAEQGIGFASISAAGAVSSVRLAYWRPETKAYDERDFDEQLEVVSFQGNVALKEDKPFFHIHGVFGRPDFSVIGGHIKEARVHPTMEIWLHAEDVPVRRGRDESSGLDLLELPGRS
jgi:predicted DNA-binding protein with PD1-like motif